MRAWCLRHPHHPLNPMKGCCGAAACEWALSLGPAALPLSSTTRHRAGRAPLPACWHHRDTHSAHSSSTSTATTSPSSSTYRTPKSPHAHCRAQRFTSSNVGLTRRVRRRSTTTPLRTSTNFTGTPSSPVCKAHSGASGADAGAPDITALSVGSCFSTASKCTACIVVWPAVSVMLAACCCCLMCRLGTGSLVRCVCVCCR